MPNVRDIESSYLYAKAQYEEWMAAFMAEWFQPDIDVAMLAMADKLDADPVLREQLRMRNTPQAWADFIQRIADARSRTEDNGI